MYCLQAGSQKVPEHPEEFCKSILCWCDNNKEVSFLYTALPWSRLVCICTDLHVYITTKYSTLYCKTHPKTWPELTSSGKYGLFLVLFWWAWNLEDLFSLQLGIRQQMWLSGFSLLIGSCSEAGPDCPYDHTLSKPKDYLGSKTWERVPRNNHAHCPNHFLIPLNNQGSNQWQIYQQEILLKWFGSI